ncbi:hypothetical protein ACFYWS_20680 [Streptomyces sp. NPDC002795]|uniref:hypothetical protein n=1 Tax=Streptomyces sp. NPDC002795 TaxID=3364665 RepID=UPI0036B56BD8
MSDTAWTRRAPCRLMSGFAPSENEWRNSTALKRMCRPHLQVCRFCDFRAECIALVKPHQAKFDGVAGGRLWCGGEVIAVVSGARDEELSEPKLRASCGTSGGERDHRRNGERVCPECASAEREATKRRREEKARDDGRLDLDFTPA